MWFEWVKRYLEALMRFLFRHNKRARIRLWQRLSIMLEHNVKEYDALVELRARRQRRFTYFYFDETYCALNSWINQMNKGRRLSEAIVGYVSLEEILLLSVSENERNSIKALRSCIVLLQAQEKILNSISRGLSYPVFLLCTTVTLLYFFSIKIIPAIESLQLVEQWHGQANRLITIAHFVHQYVFVFLFVVALLVVLFLISLPLTTNQLRTYLDQYPPYSIYRLLVGTSWLLSLSALVARDVSVRDALLLLKQNATPWLRSRIETILIYYRRGYGLSSALLLANQHFPDDAMIDDLIFYERFSHFNDALSRLANVWLETSIEHVASCMKTIFTVCLVIAGVCILMIVSGVLDMQQQLTLATQVAR